VIENIKNKGNPDQTPKSLRERIADNKRRIAAIVLLTVTVDHFTDYAGSNHLSPQGVGPHEIVLPPSSSDDIEYRLAAATTPFLYYTESEAQKAENMDTLYKVRELTEEEVLSLFNKEVKEDETWYAITFQHVYPEDGGPDKVGLQIMGHSLSLNSEGIEVASNIAEQFNHLLSKVRSTKIIDKAIEESEGHNGEIERNITYVKTTTINGEIHISFEGVHINQHGKWKFYRAEEVFYIEEDDGTLHLLLYVSIKKGTEYTSPKECNTSSITEGKVIVIPYAILRDRCSPEILHKPKILPGHNVNRGDPFLTSEILIEKYNKEESATDGSCFYGGKRNEKEEKEKCNARFDWSLPR